MYHGYSHENDRNFLLSRARKVQKCRKLFFTIQRWNNGEIRLDSAPVYTVSSFYNLLFSTVATPTLDAQEYTVKITSIHCMQNWLCHQPTSYLAEPKLGHVKKKNMDKSGTTLLQLLAAFYAHLRRQLQAPCELSRMRSICKWRERREEKCNKNNWNV